MILPVRDPRRGIHERHRLVIVLERVSLYDGAVRQGNFHQYRVARLADSPVIEVTVLPSELDPQGIGETGVPPVAPAIANAVYRATSRRLRELPLKL